MLEQTLGWAAAMQSPNTPTMPLSFPRSPQRTGRETHSHVERGICSVAAVSADLGPGCPGLNPTSGISCVYDTGQVP